jgi:hypothetical protein
MAQSTFRRTLTRCGRIICFRYLSVEGEANLREFIQEFFAVLSFSRKTEVSIIAAILSPSVILVCGVFTLDFIKFEGQFEALMVPIRRGFAMFFLAFSAVAFVQLSVIAVKKYAKARDRLLRL